MFVKENPKRKKKQKFALLTKGYTLDLGFIPIRYFEVNENILKQSVLPAGMSVILNKHYLMFDSFVIHDFEFEFS